MQEVWAKIREQTKTLWGKLALWHRIGVIAGGVVFCALLGLIIHSSLQTEYAPLFNNLEEKDAAVVVNRLKEEGVSYRLQNDGHTISVPEDVVDEMRLLFASEGLPQSGIIGYEIFDRNNIGLTDFVQKLNFKRALEGELARTIQSFEEIQFARVHIMIPEPSLFIEDEKPATASVVLNLEPGKKLKSEQVTGISNLVAASVEGLEATNVTVIDSHGKILSDNRDRDSLLELTATQLELQQRVERYFEEKLSSLISGVVGPNNHIVRVTAELDFDRVERTTETYDPESSTIRSQESDIQTNPDPNAPGSTENVITNYEISKTLERVIGGIGNIKRLSVAVMVNGKYNTVVSPSGEEVLEYTPRSEEELQKISELVRNAIGFNATRNDQVQVTNLPFDLSEAQRQQEMLDQAERTLFWQTWLFRASAVIAALALVFLIRSIVRHFQPQFPEIEEEEEPEVEDLEIPRETKVKVQKRKLVNEIAKEKPDEVAKLVKSWLIEDPVDEEEWNMKV